ncbi:MAG: glutamate-5-semialdehyde dehydrogenase [Oscillospiraceae bacterium]|jgi:glutamate-5-semialdehyde dehydrogenase|nr:glutamate-5-semialdehyde dehydrogenase [Oscillospiraceae bacterium]
MTVEESAKLAKKASRDMAAVPLAARNAALLAVADALLIHKEEILNANAQDLAASTELTEPFRKRLLYDEAKLRESIEELRAIANLPDPLGKVTLATELAEGLNLRRVTCPLGVVCMIFESRPDALVQIAALCLKSGNAVLLKGGSEAANTNQVLYDIIYEAAANACIPEGFAALLHTREDVARILTLDEYIDVIIPRGSYAFVRYIKRNSSIPVLGHADGLCHIYVDANYPAYALDVVRDSKMQYPAVCNAVETLLVHKDAAQTFLPELVRALPDCELRGDERARAIARMNPATEEDWDTEYLAPILSVKIVDSTEEAILHINTHGSGHTDAILTQSEANANAFTSLVDSADVFVNCSTRFADGYRFGFGAELGIATGKLHARGPMGLEGLTTYKYRLVGDGHTVADTLNGKIVYTHRALL